MIVFGVIITAVVFFAMGYMLGDWQALAKDDPWRKDNPDA